MSKMGILKNISLIIALLVVVYLVGNYTGTLQSTIMQLLNIPGGSVAGASTKRAQDISEKVSADISGQFGIVQEKILNLKVSDAVDGLSRLQKIPRDFHALQEYTKEQIDSMVKSKK